MGRKNRSRKRKDEMNRIKRERYAKKELERLKKMLGIDDKGNVDMKEISEIATVKTSKELKQEKRSKEEKQALIELEDERDKGVNVKVVNKNTGKVHVYNTKTFKDQYGAHPVWHKPRTAKKIRKLQHARKQRFKQAWSTTNVPL